MQAFGLMIINYSSTSIKAVNTRSFAYHNSNLGKYLVDNQEWYTTSTICPFSMLNCLTCLSEKRAGTRAYTLRRVPVSVLKSDSDVYFWMTSSSGLRGHRRTYLTILESADHALFKMVRYVLLRPLRPELDVIQNNCRVRFVGISRYVHFSPSWPMLAQGSLRKSKKSQSHD
jgi:hypothetical protein